LPDLNRITCLIDENCTASVVSITLRYLFNHCGLLVERLLILPSMRVMHMIIICNYHLYQEWANYGPRAAYLPTRSTVCIKKVVPRPRITF